jgi:hypothetical protein
VLVGWCMQRVTGGRAGADADADAGAVGEVGGKESLQSIPLRRLVMIQLFLLGREGGCSGIDQRARGIGRR